MKTVLLLVLGFSSFAFSAGQRDCVSLAKVAARSVWAVNSGIDMKDLTAEVGKIVPKQDSRNLMEVFVNTTRTGFPQNVPYEVQALQKGQNDCYIEQVRALQGYGAFGSSYGL